MSVEGKTVLVTGGNAPHLDAHLARMARSAGLHALADPGPDAWRALVAAVLDGWPAGTEGACRLFLTRGLGEGMPPTALALLAPLTADVLHQRESY